MQVNGISQVHGVHEIQPSARFTQQANSSPQPSRNQGPDEVSFSQEAELISQTREIPDIRADRVASIRAEIQAGTYETDEKLDIALSRLLDEIG